MTKMFKVTVGITMLALSWQSIASEILFSRNSIGNLPLEKDSLVSVVLIRKKFPNHKVTHRIQSGDSPDFHYIIVETKDNRHIFSIKSFFDENINERSREFDVDLLISSSSDVIDEFGIKVGDEISKVIRSRGSELEIFANHFDNSVGKEGIYYQFDVPMTAEEIENNFGVSYKNPERVTLEEVIKKNPKITSISWPRPRWE